MTREPKAATSWLYIGRGLYLATLLLVLSPTPSLGGGFTDEGALLGTRFAFFCALACSACLTTLLWKRLSPVRLHSGFIVAAMIVEIVGGLGYPLTVVGVLPQDDLVYEYDCEGKPSSQVPDSAPVKQALAAIMHKLNL